MKNIRFLTFVLAIATLLLSACGAAATAATPAPIATSGSTKVEAMPVAFVGIVDSIAGDQWVISGTTVTVHESIVRDGPFKVGDHIKVEGFVNPDGSLTVSRVETPTPKDAATQPPFVEDNSNEAISNANTNDANVNDGNINDGNINDDNSSGINSNDANANINDDHGGNGNSNDDNSSGINSNDDNSNTSNSNDANANGGNGNINDDNSNTANSNDDKGGNSNDDNGGGGGNSNDANANGNGG